MINGIRLTWKAFDSTSIRPGGIFEIAKITFKVTRAAIRDRAIMAVCSDIGQEFGWGVTSQSPDQGLRTKVSQFHSNVQGFVFVAGFAYIEISETFAL
jgi:hypothetical protein